ncbi:MAG TPA: aminotransferase class V-fold PLP-dependent enzyme [Chloroflexota bacterium]|nr:aminotransferase class V-fold PLP-dependent enzyme [Chloroflexota bacterium]
MSIDTRAALNAQDTHIYDMLGVRPFINAAGTYTRLGGSRMPPVVVEAMVEASRHFVEIDELQARAGARLAELTRNEAAYVTCGAAAGLLVATAACLAGNDPARARQLPDLTGMRSDIVMYHSHRNPYDYAVRTLPIRLIEVGFPNEVIPPTPWELEHALTDQTAAVIYVEARWTARGALPLDEVVAIAHRRDIPVIVDAAAQLPPRENLWRLTQAGADLVIFSGGKDLRGPQSSGLIVGRRDLVDACFLIGAPHHGICRPLKAGKEEIVGLVAAVERYMAQDEEARLLWTERFVDRAIEQLSGPGVEVRRCFPNEAGQPIPRALVTFMGDDAGRRRDHVIHLLQAGRPSVEVAPAGLDGLYVNPMTVDTYEEDPLFDRLCAAMAGSRA